METSIYGLRKIFMANDKETRDRVRALVRDVLERVPVEADAPPEILPQRVVVNSLKDGVGKEFDRDESAKSLITEDDLRGLDDGAKVRVSENAKFTPLASDLIKERRIELVIKSAAKVSRQMGFIAKN